MKLGIVGLPNVGKSTLFNALNGGGAQSANYPFCTIDPNVGIVPVPDERLEKLANIYNPKRVTPATIEFVDIAGLVEGASRGEGLGNKFLANIREVDAILHVVRCFENSDIVHVNGKVNPLHDIEIINMELILSDIEITQRRLEKSSKMLKGDKSLQVEVNFLKKLLEALENGINARNVEVNDIEEEILNSISLLSSKPVIYTCNVSEDDFINGIESNNLYKSVAEVANKENSAVIAISAAIEAELAELNQTDRIAFLKDLGLDSSGLDRLITKSYELLGLISFLTAGEPEVRAWTITRGTKAPQAAGKIHSDIERGFIRAEVIAFNELTELGSLAAAREKGKIRSEGKEYEMADGDVVLFRFNV